MLNLDSTQFESTFVTEIVEVKQFAGSPNCDGQVRVATAQTWKPRLHMDTGAKDNVYRNLGQNNMNKSSIIKPLEYNMISYLLITLVT